MCCWWNNTSCHVLSTCACAAPFCGCAIRCVTQTLASFMDCSYRTGCTLRSATIAPRETYRTSFMEQGQVFYCFFFFFFVLHLGQCSKGLLFYIAGSFEEQKKLKVDNVQDLVMSFLISRYNIDNNFKFSLCLGITKGMAYLHSQKLIHGSLTSSKIFIDDLWSVRVRGNNIAH